ncbi:MAG: hypothetical protein ACOCRX_08870 [Candidatus Woesearchaeota archaeon]
MLRYKSLFFIESENYLFRYNTNNDKLFIVQNKDDYKDYRLNKAKETKIDSIYQREMIEQALDKR